MCQRKHWRSEQLLCRLPIGHQSHNPQKQRQRAIDAQEEGVVGLPDDLADLGDGSDGDLVYRDLGHLAPAVVTKRGGSSSLMLRASEARVSKHEGALFGA